MKKELASASALFIAAAHVPAQAAALAQVASPDGSIVVTLDADNDKRIRYTVSRRGKLLIAPSLLGFILTDSYNMVRGFGYQGSKTASSDTTWEQPWGERRFVRSHYNELLVCFKQPAYLQRQMNIRFRVFDNGVGFRYELPDQPNLKTMRIADESTEFDIAQPGQAWWIPGGE
jgi:alpha-glucosidase